MKSKVGAAAVNWQVKNAVELQQQEQGGNISFVTEAAVEENLWRALSRVRDAFVFPSFQEWLIPAS